VTALLQLHEGGLSRLRHAGLVHHQVAADVYDLLDMLDEYRTLVLAGTAGQAVPYGVEAHGLGQRYAALARDVDVQYRYRHETRCVHQQLLAELVGDLLRGQLLLGVVGGTGLLAAAALGAGVAVQELPPGVVLDAPHAEHLLRLEVGDGLEDTRGLKATEEDVGGGTEDV